ncbi:hypothetical protein [Glutamicibacter nicotianae]|uniref:hypothetical protein n=1 Tax=Glutamicibacter nicotianae TaxID=37929 RepID=UPI0013CEEF7A|nr:hypothetical protein [Glutamicibacter nicotianae]
MKESTANASWNKILLPLAPNGIAPAKNSPQHLVADLCATTLKPQRQFNPELLNVKEMIPEDVWVQLLDDADKSKHQKFEHYGREVSDVGESLKRILVDQVVNKDIIKAPRPMSDDIEATFLYYQNGQGLPLHLDNDATYEYNLLICLDKMQDLNNTDAGSATYFYLGEGAVKAAILQPGYGVWFHSGYTPHGRIPLKTESEISLLSVGMKVA